MEQIPVYFETNMKFDVYFLNKLTDMQ